MKRTTFVLLLAVSCRRDPHTESLTQARYAVDALVQQGAAFNDPRFDSVIAQLKHIPPTHSSHAPAQQLLQTLEGGRVRSQAPLALNLEAGNRPPELMAQLQACARLAELAGLDGGVKKALPALEECRKKAEVMELKWAHGEEASPSP